MNIALTSTAACWKSQTPANRFLFGMAREDLSRLDTYDEFFPLLVAVRARKGPSDGRPSV
jgi:hypothetical protein